MKKKFTLVVLVMALLVNTAIPVFAASRLNRPVIDVVDSGKSSIKLDWDYVRGADAYKIYRATSSNGTYRLIGSHHESWYRDYDITKGKKYYYKVRAVSHGSRADSYLSKWRSAKVNKPAPKPSKPAVSVSQTVYITNTGEKYHHSGCVSLRRSCIPISLSSAKSRGYTACKLCC